MLQRAQRAHLQLPRSGDIFLHLLIAGEIRTDGRCVAVIGGCETGIVGNFKLVVFARENTDLQRREAGYAETVLLKEWNIVLLDFLTRKKVVLGLLNL